MNPDNSPINTTIKTTIRAGIFTLLATFLVACSDNSPTYTTVSIGDNFAEAGSNAVVSAKVDLIPMDFLDWDLEMSNIGGQIVVMDFWATWCVPCIERFPAMVDSRLSLGIRHSLGI